VTPKGERLDEDFVSSLSKPFYILFVLNTLFLVAGVVRLIFQPELASVTIITMVWASINVIFILAAIGIMLEKAQKRSAYRININNPLSFPMSYDSGHELGSCTLENISHTGMKVRIKRMQTLPKIGDSLNFSIYIPALDRLGCFHAQIVNLSDNGRKGLRLGLVFKAENQDEKRAIVGLVYGWSDLSDYNQQSRQKRITPHAGLFYLFNIALFHAWEHVVFLSREYFRATMLYVNNLIQRLRTRLIHYLTRRFATHSPSTEIPHDPQK